MVIPFCVVLKQEREYNRASGKFYAKGYMKHFIQADKDIFYCEGVITKDGEMVKLSLTDKMIYFHMADRKRLFSDKGSKHFESQSTIATLLFIDTKTAAKSLTKLLQSGLVFGHKETHPSRGYSHWVYTDVNTSPVVYGDKRKNVPTSTSNDNTDSDWDDIQLPF